MSYLSSFIFFLFTSCMSWRRPEQPGRNIYIACHWLDECKHAS